MNLRSLTVLGLAWLAAGEVPRALAQDLPRAALVVEPGDILGLGERAFLRLTLEGAGDERPSPSFQLENFRLAAGPSQTTGLVEVAGVPVQRLTLTWALEPSAVGPARVYAGKVRVAGVLIDLPECRVEVVAEAPARGPAGGSAGRDPLEEVFFRRPGALEDVLGRRGPRSPPRRRQARVFLEAEATPSNPWVGQQVLYTLYLFTDVDVRAIEPQELPEFHGFWAHDLPRPERVTPEVVERGGQRIYRGAILERALFPRRGGTFEIPAVEASMEALVEDTLGSLLTRPHRVSRTSNPVTVDVRELPAAPDGFRGAVGELALDARVMPRDVEVGAAATLTLTLSGSGHLQGVPAPQLPELPGVDVFPPQQQGEETVRGQRVGGTRVWSYVLVPQRPGEWRLEGIEIPYFDPGRQSFRVARTSDLVLTARQAAGRAAAHQAEAHPIRPGAQLASGGDGRWTDLLPWLFGLPWALAILFFGVRRFGGRGGRHGRRLLRRLRAAAGDGQPPRQTAARLEEAWRDYLRERWDVAPATPSPQWGEALIAAGASAESADALSGWVADLRYLRDAPKLSSTEELGRELVGRSEQLLRALR